MAPPQASSADVVAHIKHLYHAYRHAADIDSKGLFFSPTCLQICRPTPSYAATTRKEIVQYLKDAQQGKRFEDKQTVSKAEGKGRGVYTIRPLKPSEYEFSSDDITALVDLTAEEMKQKSVKEKWIGMRVDLWDEGGEGGLLVKVQYWWRLETVLDDERFDGEDGNYGWRQCLHDILYLGPKDGTEGKEELDVLA